MYLFLVMVATAAASLEPKDSPYNHPEIISYDVPIYGTQDRNFFNRFKSTDEVNEIPHISTALELPKEDSYNPPLITTYFYTPDKEYDGKKPAEVIEVMQVPQDVYMYDVPKVQLELETDRPYGTDNGYRFDKKSSFQDSYHKTGEEKVEDNGAGRHYSRHYSHQYDNSQKHSSSFDYKTTGSLFKNSPFFARLERLFQESRPTIFVQNPTTDSKLNHQEFQTAFFNRDSSKWNNEWSNYNVKF